VLYLVFYVPIAFVVFPVTVLALAFVMVMLYFLREFVFQTLGFLTAVVLAQVIDLSPLLAHPVLEVFAIIMMLFAMVSPFLIVFVFLLTMEMLHFFGQLAF